MGQQVASLVDRLEDAGTHRITWSGENHPTGIYLARLAIDGQTVTTQKLVLVK